MADKLAPGQVSLRVRHLSSVSVILPMFHTHSYSSVAKNTNSVTKEYIKQNKQQSVICMTKYFVKTYYGPLGSKHAALGLIKTLILSDK